MFHTAPSFERLVDAFHRLPGIGRRTAERLALHLITAAPDEAGNLSAAVRDARERIGLCEVCALPTEVQPCVVCSDHRRQANLLCIVERPAGAIAIDKSGAYSGRFHVLHGALNPLEGIGPHELRLDRLWRRIDEGGVDEVILATNSTSEGEATALYLARQLAERGVRVSRIAQGVPMGGGLEYADDATLSHALEGRTRL